jgi:hypothetical protein
MPAGQLLQAANQLQIYDNHGTLVEIHEKYPMDKGHRKAQED